LRAVRRLRVGELELAGRKFRDAAERRPVAQRLREIRGRRHAEERAGIVGEGELERAVGQSLRADGARLAGLY
jgi:hypothetical protein